MSSQWDYRYDDDHARVEREDAVIVEVHDNDGNLLASLGGITLASLSVSDHGNVNVSPEDERYLASVAADLTDEDTGFIDEADKRAEDWRD